MPNYTSKVAKADVTVLIIGAGAGGLAMGYQLKHKLRCNDFRIVERRSGIGGSWWSNRYPGVACDVPSALYSFSFSPYYTSTRLYPDGSEFRQYLETTAAKFDLKPHIQLNTDVTDLRWISDVSQWEATLTHLVPGAGDLSTRERETKISSQGREAVILRTEKIRAKVVVSCRDTFKGPVFHTARWRPDVDLNGKNVVVIGAGCSAAQVVPSLLGAPYHVKSLTQIIRQAPWVMSRLEEPFGKEKFAKYAPTVLYYLPVLGWLYRIGIHILVEVIFVSVFKRKNVKWRKAIEKSTLDRMKELVPEKYHEMMTPDYAYGCKRRVFDSEWLTSMRKPNFKLVNREILAVEEKGLILGVPYVGSNTHNNSSENTPLRDIRIPADAIILATGFQTTSFLHPLTVHGLSNISLHTLWRHRGAPQAYMGIAVDDFPNFFMCLGPNTVNGTHSLLLVIENMAGYIGKVVEPVVAGRVATVEVRREAVERWTGDVRRDLGSTVFGGGEGGCRSWYVEEGRVSGVLYP
ncbi:FAD/NAD(P)-binding domain-containing protein [Byssothecium circinans]|uniref:FAD/NAD(P)-binding domain-containing protein n=1 Tax=Byssothecium circinans TaxID=147558 RepID=A0A6A5TK48_9PLEO|nr:FAD/NAD(P)-binding domain-containing protein [Byssothecium circinans]